jgi:hypothetical protein
MLPATFQGNQGMTTESGALWAGWKPWMKFVAAVGIPGALALLYAVSGEARADTKHDTILSVQTTHVAQTTAEHLAQTQALVTLSDNQDKLAGAASQDIRVLIALIRQICAQGATSDISRRDCFR